jgi:hypothetical protein
LAALSWQGRPNPLSSRQVQWPIIDDVTTATLKPATDGAYGPTSGAGAQPAGTLPVPVTAGPLLRQIIRQRRSAVAMDGRGAIDRDAFYRILRKTLPGPAKFPFNSLPWGPQVHLALFVHRVEGLAAGLYLLVRQREQKTALQATLREDFAWDRPSSCPPELGFYRLVTGDVRAIAQQLSCQQEIAADGCFSLGMIARFDEPLQRFGPWFYRRLFWECGMIGQVLYLEAEAAGARGTGIGCFFDDAVHQLLGLETTEYQSLYHFTVGHPVEDPRLTTLPGYEAGR